MPRQPVNIPAPATIARKGVRKLFDEPASKPERVRKGSTLLLPKEVRRASPFRSSLLRDAGLASPLMRRESSDRVGKAAAASPKLPSPKPHATSLPRTTRLVEDLRAILRADPSLETRAVVNPRLQRAITELHKRPEPDRSLTVRDRTNCKDRPRGYHPKRAGGGASKDFIPWCDNRR